MAGAVKSNKIKKTAASDWMEIEKQRGISVATSVMGFNYGDYKINILDIDQSIIQGYFHMMMIVDANGADKEFASLVKDLDKIGEDLGVQIKMQHEEIFDIMHRI